MLIMCYKMNNCNMKIKLKTILFFIDKERETIEKGERWKMEISKSIQAKNEKALL